jgi:hypothetical protein
MKPPAIGENSTAPIDADGKFERNFLEHVLPVGQLAECASSPANSSTGTDPTEWKKNLSFRGLVAPGLMPGEARPALFDVVRLTAGNVAVNE